MGVVIMVSFAVMGREGSGFSRVLRGLHWFDDHHFLFLHLCAAHGGPKTY